MTVTERKAMIAAYKERKTIAGVFAVICTATGQTWVGTTRHIDTQKNGLWAGLRLGSSPYRALQQAWNAHTEADFRYEQLDRLPHDMTPLGRGMELKERSARWRERLGAVPL